jgi:hypothetical protein
MPHEDRVLILFDDSFSSMWGRLFYPNMSSMCPRTRQRRVVDVVMYRKLGEIDLEQETLDEILITLPGCQHVFTVETLDGICDMTAFYRRDDADRWVGFADPPTGFRKPPTCPTCRTAITSPRYGRIFKRADLDILENNVASQMSNSLEDVRKLIGLLSKADMERMVTKKLVAQRLPVPL